MPGYRVVITCSSAFSSFRFPSPALYNSFLKRSFLSSATRTAVPSPYRPPFSSSRNCSPSMYRFVLERPPSCCIEIGFLSLQKRLFSLASRSSSSPKAAYFASKRFGLNSPFLRNTPSSAILDGAALSRNALPGFSEGPKLLSSPSNCERETGTVLTNSGAHLETAAEGEELIVAKYSQAPESPSPGEGVHVEVSCQEDKAFSGPSLLSDEAEAQLPRGSSSRKSSLETLTSRVRNRSERRRKGVSSFARNIQNEFPDLLAVPGIGPRNFEKLVAKGIGKVAELKQLYRDKEKNQQWENKEFLNDESTKMVEFLQSSVGIVHKHHAESITLFVKKSVDEEQKEQSNLDKESNIRQKKKVTICVEGNISVGKTTFLQKIASEIVELRDLVEIVPEPVDKWKDVGPDHLNLLDAFYNEPERYAYTFQNYVFATRLMKEQETSRGIKPLRLMERSIFSDRLVFVRAVHEAKWMSELELRIYESWFDPFISALPGLVPDGFIYLRASPDTCLQRLHMRNRPEERGVTLEYLRGLHEKHEQCFFPSENVGGIYSVKRLPTGPHKIPPPPRIRDRVFYLEGDHLHSSIRKVPALILDCEASIDFNRDLEARAEYAQQVAEFYEYIKSSKDLDTNDTAPSGTVNPFLLPYTGGLLKPDGSPFLHGHHLDAFNLGRHQHSFVTRL